MKTPELLYCNKGCSSLKIEEQPILLSFFGSNKNKKLKFSLKRNIFDFYPIEYTSDDVESISISSGPEKINTTSPTDMFEKAIGFAVLGFIFLGIPGAVGGALGGASASVMYRREQIFTSFIVKFKNEHSIAFRANTTKQNNPLMALYETQKIKENILMGAK